MKRKSTRKGTRTTRTTRTRNRKKRGGTKYFYSYNTKPLMFTNVSNRQQGGFLGMGDPRYTILPSVANDAVQNLQYSLSSSSDSYAGNYQGVNSNWRIQPIK